MSTTSPADVIAANADAIDTAVRLERVPEKWEPAVAGRSLMKPSGPRPAMAGEGRFSERTRDNIRI